MKKLKKGVFNNTHFLMGSREPIGNDDRSW